MNGFLDSIKAHSSLPIMLRSEIIDTIVRFSAGPRTSGQRDLVTHLCWAIGSSNNCEEEDGIDMVEEDRIREFHQPLELLLYERISVARWLVKAEIAENEDEDEENDFDSPRTENKDEERSEEKRKMERMRRRNYKLRRMEMIRTEMNDEARLLSVVISAITKLASHQTDLSPRVLLCLAKIVSKDARSSFHDSVVRRARESMRLLEYPSTFSMLGRFEQGDGLLSRIRSNRVGSALHAFGE